MYLRPLYSDGGKSQEENATDARKMATATVSVAAVCRLNSQGRSYIHKTRKTYILKQALIICFNLVFSGTFPECGPARSSSPSCFRTTITIESPKRSRRTLKAALIFRHATFLNLIKPSQNIHAG